MILSLLGFNLFSSFYWHFCVGVLHLRDGWIHTNLVGPWHIPSDIEVARVSGHEAMDVCQQDAGLVSAVWGVVGFWGTADILEALIEGIMVLQNIGFSCWANAACVVVL